MLYFTYLLGLLLLPLALAMVVLLAKMGDPALTLGFAKRPATRIDRIMLALLALLSAVAFIHIANRVIDFIINL